jgi:hypothetical protein
MSKMFVLPLAFSATLLAAAYGGGAEDVEKAEEEAGLEEVVPEETTVATQTEWAKMSEAEKGQQKAKNMEKGPQSASPFEGEHEDLQSGATATWSSGLAMTVSDVHISPNARLEEAITKAEENKANAEERKAKSKDPSKGPDPEKIKAGPAEDEPEELIAFHWHVENNGAEPVSFGGDLPCEVLDENGLVAPHGKSGSRAERQEPTPIAE